MDDIETSSEQLAKPLGKRRLWVVVILSLLGSGLPFIYCGNLKLGILIEIAYLALEIVSAALILVFPTYGYLLFLFGGPIIASIVFLVYAIRYARQFNRETPIIYANVWLKVIITFIVFSIIGEASSFCIKTSLVEAYKIPSGSMENTLLVGDYLLADKSAFGLRLPIPFTDIKLHSDNEPQINDILIFIPPGQVNPFVNRCVATAGKTVEIVNKQLLVDSIPVPLPPGAVNSDINLYPYRDETSWRTGPAGRFLEQDGCRDNMPPFIVPDGKIFMMGDNRDNSWDSRFYGCVDCDRVLGKVMIIHFSWASFDPCDSLSRVSRPPATTLSRPWTFIRCVCFHVCHFYEHIRWSRIGTRF